MLVHGCSVPELDQRAMESLQREDGKRARFWNGELWGEWPARFKANHRAVTKLAMHNGGWRQHRRLKEAAAANSTMWWRTDWTLCDGRTVNNAHWASHPAGRISLKSMTGGAKMGNCLNFDCLQIRYTCNGIILLKLFKAILDMF